MYRQIAIAAGQNAPICLMAQNPQIFTLPASNAFSQKIVYDRIITIDRRDHGILGHGHGPSAALDLRRIDFPRDHSQIRRPRQTIGHSFARPACGNVNLYLRMNLAELFGPLDRHWVHGPSP